MLCRICASICHIFQKYFVKDDPYFVHGIDVAYSTFVTAKIREAVLNREFLNTIYREDAENIKAIWRRYTVV